MNSMSRAKVIASLALVAATTLHCMIPDLPSEEGVCPCAPGYTCDDDRGVCVPKDEAHGSGGGASRRPVALRRDSAERGR